MSIEILHDAADERAVMFCNTSDWAFGPLIIEHNLQDGWVPASEVAELFLEYLSEDARHYEDNVLEKHYAAFVRELPALLAARREEDEEQA